MTQGDQSDSSPLSGPYMLERRTSKRIPGTPITQDLCLVNLVSPGEQVVPVIGVDGKAMVMVIPPIFQGEYVRGCAICEQLHPEIGYEGCPLDQGEVVERALGPLYVDGEPIYFQVKELR